MSSTFGQYVIPLTIMFLFVNVSYALPLSIDTTAFVANQVLSCPTDTSITIRVVPEKVLQIYFEYGTTPSVYSLQTETITSVVNVPVKFVLRNLFRNTRYFYRIRYRENGASQFVVGDQCTFMTQRPRGIPFRFGLTSDSHLYDKKGIASMMKVTMQNLLNDSLDFTMEMGDTFGDDRDPPRITQQQMMKLHLNYLPYIGMVAHTSPFYFCLGNHEGESGFWLLQTPPNNLAVWGTLARKYYYSNPTPNGFYSGNTTFEPYGMGLPENYFAWEWGDALFTVIDVYRYAVTDTMPGLWNWTLGAQQYNWFKQTLESSTARYKFVFAHHVRGYGRGGIIVARNFEWGGYENNGTTWGFATNRPGWAMPIHQLMVANGVNIFFQGHDHLFAHEVLDGVVYQEVPMPGDSTYMIGMLANADAYTGVKLDGTGHLRVSVGSDSAKVEYIRAYLPQDTNATRRNGEIAFKYAVARRPTAAELKHETPLSMRLEQNYPNPFNPDTRIAYTISETRHVSLKMFDLLGREVATLVDESKQSGTYVANVSIRSTVEGGNDSRWTSGIYFYRLKVGASTITRKAVLIK